MTPCWNERTGSEGQKGRVDGKLTEGETATQGARQKRADREKWRQGGIDRRRDREKNR